MTRNIIKYISIALIIAGIILVVRNLFKSDSEWHQASSKEITYTANINLYETNTENFITDADLVIKDENDEIISKWTTEDKTHQVKNLKPGAYTLEQVTTKEGYKLDEEGVYFKIEDTNTTVVMYNSKLTEEEKETLRKQNTTSNEIGVENTSSTKNIALTLISIITLILGTITIIKAKNNYNN